MRDLKPLKPDRVVLIGASTGGPVQIKKLLASLSKDIDASIVVAQHMSQAFIPSFIKQLNENTPLPVRALEKGAVIEPGNVYIAAGKCNIELSSYDIVCSKVDIVENSYNPDINYLFKEFAKFTPQIDILSVILTGIGDDGVSGCRVLAENGAECIAESEESAIVYGMPQRATEIVERISVQSLNEIILSVQRFCRVV